MRGQSFQDRCIADKLQALLDEWNYERNGNVKPTDVTCGGSVKVWWKCNKGHEWEASVNSRVNQHAGCPFCSGNKVIEGETDLLSLFPDIAKEWHPAKNGDLYPSVISSKSGKKVWWKCLEGHEWKMSINNRTSQKQNCPYCSGQRVIEGVNDLQTLFPDIAKEWHPTKNKGLTNGHHLLVDTANRISAHTNIKVWWQCEKGHEWQQSVNSRVDKNCGCSICSSRKLLKGFNDLETVNPDLAKEWHPTKNGNLKPGEITYCKNQKVWWLGKCGHEWEQSVNSRSKGVGCPYCSGNKVINGKTDLQTLFPEIAKEWHPTKNGSLKPKDVASKSGKKVWWLCEKGHEWQSAISGRTCGNGCPICSNRQILPGFNDLLTWCIDNKRNDLLNEWDYKKNSMDASQFSPMSLQKVWWICKYGHKWSAAIANRTHNRSGCPICNKENRTSWPEQALFYYIRYYFPDTINTDNHIGVELDIYVPSLKTAIEYDGLNWHKKKANVDKDARKNKICIDNKITLIRVREIGLPHLEDCVIFVREDTTSDVSLQTVIVDVLAYLGVSNASVDLGKDYSTILEMFIAHKDENSIISRFPEVANEWHPTKNGDLKPDYFNYGSQRKVWWQCEKGHEWQAVIGSRCKASGRGRICPFCSGKEILKGFNDFKTWCLKNNKHLLDEWDYEENKSILPEDFGRGSNEKVSWKCQKGHKWQATIGSRVSMHSGCPECSKLLLGKQSMKSVKCIETGLEYNSMKEASDKTGLNSSDISACCRGKQKTAGGFHWEYID